MVYEYKSKEGFKFCKQILVKEFGEKKKKKTSKFVFKIYNNRGVVVSEFSR